jgi:Domain of unknown function (DUF4349)/Putative zinc-finger
MNEHTWFLENVAAFVVGGLAPEEVERLQRHVSECADCAGVLAETECMDRGLSTLFAASRPDGMMENRMNQAVRTAAASAALRRRRMWMFLGGTAAAWALTLAGAGIGKGTGQGFRFPGGESESESSKVDAAIKKLTEDFSFSGQTNCESSTGGSAEPTSIDESSSMIDGRKVGRQEEGNYGPRTNYKSERISESDKPGLPGAPEGPARTVAPPPGIGRDDLHLKMARTEAAIAEKAREEAKIRWVRSESLSAKGGISNEEMDSNKLAYERATLEATLKQDQLKALEKEIKSGPSVFKPLDFAPSPGEDNTPKSPITHQPDTPATKPTPSTDPAPEVMTIRRVIRSGDIEFEVDSFDSALAMVEGLVLKIKGAFVATVNSDKLANGKVKGSLVVRLPPDSLDGFVLDLRRDLGKNGELKGQKIGSEDITKKYTDLESHLKAARTMEQRLLQIIKEGKGEIKQLLEAEKELGVWRTKIEEYEGEIRYYSNLVALSTLTVTLAERDMRKAADVVQTERVQAGIEVEDVVKARDEIMTAVATAKGRVTKSELKQHSEGQFNATLNFEVAPEAAGPLRDRLKQAGRVARLEIDFLQKPEGGSDPGPSAKVKRGDTQFLVQIYNLTNVAAREASTLQVAATDVNASYRNLQNAVAKANGRILTARLDEQDRRNVKGQLDFEVRRSEEDAITAALTAAGDLLSRNVLRAEASENVTDSKVLYKVSLFSAASIAPRETTTLAIEVNDVSATMGVFAAHVSEAKGRVVESSEARERNGKITAKLMYDVPLSAEASVVDKLKSAGVVRVQQVARNAQAPDGPLAVARIEVTLANGDLLVPADDGLWAQTRKGLSLSLTVLLWSVSWLIVGLCVVVPWALIAYGGYRIVRRLRPATPPITTTPT